MNDPAKTGIVSLEVGTIEHHFAKGNSALLIRFIPALVFLVVRK